MKTFRLFIVRKCTAAILLASLAAAFLADLKSGQSASVLALWLTDRMTSGSTDTLRQYVLDEAGRSETRASFFVRAAAIIQQHPSDFDLPFAPNSRSEEQLAAQLEQAWDNRFNDSGMSGAAERVEPGKNWHVEGKNFLTHAFSTESVRAGINRSVFETTCSDTPALEPLESGISIGAP